VNCNLRLSRTLHFGLPAAIVLALATGLLPS